MRKLLTLLILPFFFFVFTQNVSALSEFASDVEVSYNISPEGKTIVIHNISLTNLFSDLYATSYSLILDNIEPKNPNATENGKALNLQTSSEGTNTTLKVKFDDAVVGKDKSRKFQIAFEEDKTTTKAGEVWEINIPRISSEESFNSYSLKLVVPASFGQLAYLSPEAENSYQEGSNYIYTFNRRKVAGAGITAGFGEFQVFSFNLNYHLENPLTRTSKVEIAIPPDTQHQKMYYTSISPEPANIEVDEDGNWIAHYSLKARERIDVVANGSVQIFSSARPFLAPSAETLMKNLQEKQYWEISDSNIKEAAKNLKKPEDVYNFVVKNLTYDYTRVRPNVERLGAKEALSNPTAAICMEFTDLFIALARAAGIPAREINGYAYTENPEIQPLSLVADVLHAWPEYWDQERLAWIPVDPTWGSTTGGVDFFNKLDLRHFTFVIHGSDSLKPFPPGSYKLGANPQKDVFVNFGRLPEKRNSEVQLSIGEKRNIPFLAQKFMVQVNNPGPGALNNLDVGVYFDQNLQQSIKLPILIPFSSYEFEIAVPFSFLGSATPHNVTIKAGSSFVEVATAKNLVIIYSLGLFSIFLIALLVFLLIRTKRVQIVSFLAKIGSRFKNKSEQTTSKSNEDQKNP